MEIQSIRTTVDFKTKISKTIEMCNVASLIYVFKLINYLTLKFFILKN